MVAGTADRHLGLCLRRARPPTGGPPDATPPALEFSEPAAGSVDVETDRLTFTFSEPVDEASLLNAFSITPELLGPIEVKSSGRTVTVRLPETLREETTYRVTLDTSLRDRRSVSLDAPITLAFATGSEIDTAKLAGHMVRATDGSPASGIDVLAYASPIPLLSPMGRFTEPRQDPMGDSCWIMCGPPLISSLGCRISTGTG